MIHISPYDINFDPAWEVKARELTKELQKKKPEERAAFIDSKRAETWGNEALLESLRGVVGNKCWYSEVPLDGADPNVDHFRPKGRVIEIDHNRGLRSVETRIAAKPCWQWVCGDVKNWRVPTTLAPLFLPVLCRKPLVAVGLQDFPGSLCSLFEHD
ncbi:MAG: hypothetical protein ACD_17C00220G0001 [uncultured bacterium]|nr:MAG: hypothetical protein ACD_17C00220G0001 [uncultured bacterium]